MLQNFIGAVLIFLFSGVFALVFGQTPAAAVKPIYPSGDVAAISSKSIVITTKTGQLETLLTEKTAYKRLAADSLNLAAATPGALSDIGVGDRVTVSALLAADGKSLNARTVYFVTKADIAAKNAKETAEWRTRGIAGKVTTVNALTGLIVVEIGGLMGKSNMTLTPNIDAKILRYATDSIKFSDAKASSLSEIKPGDQIRALGNKSADGATFSAETILTGAFRQTAGTVKSVDVPNNEVVIKDVMTGKEVTIAFGEAVMLKRFPPEMAERMAAFQGGGMGGMRASGQGQPAGQGATPPAGPRQAMGGPRGLDDLLERAPNITAADLKVDEIIAVLTSAPNGAPVDRVKAIKLVAGVEPFLRLAQAAGGRRGQGQGLDISIPGLDGIGIP